MAARKRKKLKFKKVSGARAKRRKKIREKLDKHLADKVRAHELKEERELHGVKTREIHTIEGKEKTAQAEALMEETDFFQREEPFGQGMFFLEVDEDGRPSTYLAHKAPKQGALINAVKHDFGLHETEIKLLSLEEQALELARVYGIASLQSGESIEKKVETMEREVETMLDLIELEKKIKKELFYINNVPERGTPNFERQAERAHDLTRQLALHKMAFHSALIYAFISDNPNCSAPELSKKLSLEAGTINSCLYLLKKKKLVKESRGKTKKFSARKK